MHHRPKQTTNQSECNSAAVACSVAVCCPWQLQSKSNLFIAKSRKRGVSSDGGGVYEVCVWPLSAPAATFLAN